MFPQRFVHILTLSLFLTLWSCPSAWAESKMTECLGVYYFGYGGFDLEKIKNAMPFTSGDKIDQNEWLNNRDKVFNSVRQATAKEATDAAFVNCNQKVILFVGVAGKTYIPAKFKKAPSQNLSLPKELIDCYEQMMDASSAGVSTGAKEKMQEADKKTEELKRLGTTIVDQLVKVLLNSADARQRYVAAYALGLLAQRKNELDALISATIDPDSTVRNNAVRELCDSARQNPKLAAQIDPRYFIRMLSSGTWTDRNKSSFMMEVLTRSRSHDLLRRLHRDSLATLIEMANWNKSHAWPSLVILGRMGKLSDNEIEQLISENQIQIIISKAKQGPKSSNNR
jgi:hypothetical protein